MEINLSNNLENQLKNMIEAEGLKLYDTEIVKEGEKTIFRVLIIRPNGSVSINDCVNITNIISPFLDVEEPVSGKYTLEVSSPGIERILTKPHHFELSIGNIIKVQVKNSNPSKFKGKLISVDKNSDNDFQFTLQIDEVQKSFLLSEVKKAKIVFEWK
jgi:ribosome maturation factor RimP